MGVLVDIRNLDFAYGEQLVLKHINLPIDTGSTLGVIGPNGGGKTTLLRLLLGRHAPTRGSITLDGLSPQRAVARGDVIGYLPQNYAAPADFPMSVSQVVETGLAGKAGLFKPALKEDRGFARFLLDRVGLAGQADRPISSISGGQRQRAMIARALVARPRLLLLDEPTTGIDATGQKRFVDFLADLRREMNLTLVLVSHDLRAVSAIADRVACLNVTLHYHDAPGQMPAELVRELFPEFTEHQSRAPLP